YCSRGGLRRRLKRGSGQEDTWAKRGLAMAQNAPEPLGPRQPIRAELLELPLVLGEEQRAIGPELGGDRRVEQAARIGGAHLEANPHLELAQLRALHAPLQVRQVVAPDDRVQADGGAFAQQVDEELLRRGRLIRAAEAEIILVAAQVAQPLQAEQDEKTR